MSLYAPGEGRKPLSGVDIRTQFRPDEPGRDAEARNLNAAFLLSLCGPSQPLYEGAVSYLRGKRDSEDNRTVANFYMQGRRLVPEEFLGECSKSETFEERVVFAHAWIQDGGCEGESKATVNRIWQVFFPEGEGLLEKWDDLVKALRKKRTVQITRLNPSPLTDPGRQLLFTSNVLLTVPSDRAELECLPFSKGIRDSLEHVVCEPQLFWYDHPIQVGIDPQQNEVIYGLQGLDEAMAFEKERGTLDPHEKVPCVLSISVTHRGLQGIAAQCVREMLERAGRLNHLRIYAFTEADTLRLVNEVMEPAAQRYFPERSAAALKAIIGVDGEYGRHYSFLKAVSAFWQVFVDPGIKGTFKIDLDQIFPQRELVGETGSSAVEHFKTPLWGAEGVDSQGQLVSLGMIAGTLVNRKDATSSLFTPDVVFPSRSMHGDEWIFNSALPQAFSTKAEMMARYGGDSLDGRRFVFQRVHVTGGTTGILVRDLRKYRPFTPGFVGRAEDQAYLLSALGRSSPRGLRYLHKDGLVMRHDKEDFAEEAMTAAATGKMVGDYIRILTFSRYAAALPGGVTALKDSVDPFTGCFISRIPMTVVYLRFALKVASGFQAGDTGKTVKLIKMGANRICKAIEEMILSKDGLKEIYKAERKAWDLYYDILDRVEQGLKARDPYALHLRKCGRRLLQECLVVS